jgi:hypothetical protein
MEENANQAPQSPGNPPTPAPVGMPVEPQQSSVPPPSPTPPVQQPPIIPSNPTSSSKKLLMWVIIGGLVAVLAAIGVGIWWHTDKMNTSKTTSMGNMNMNTPMSTIPASTPAAATDSASLQQDLNSINGGLSQGSQNQSDANSALNDQQIQVPTN